MLKLFGGGSFTVAFGAILLGAYVKSWGHYFTALFGVNILGHYFIVALGAILLGA
jgi:hypothetical protein